MSVITYMYLFAVVLAVPAGIALLGDRLMRRKK